MNTTLNRIVLAASVAMTMTAAAGAAYADSIIPALRYPSLSQTETVRDGYYARPVAARNAYTPYYGTQAYDAQASMDYAPFSTSRCTYQGGPKTGTMSCGY
jgi:hypothetical protein